MEDSANLQWRGSRTAVRRGRCDGGKRRRAGPRTSSKPTRLPCTRRTAGWWRTSPETRQLWCRDCPAGGAVDQTCTQVYESRGGKTLTHPLVSSLPTRIQFLCKVPEIIVVVEVTERNQILQGKQRRPDIRMWRWSGRQKTTGYCEVTVQNWMPLTLLPNLSSGGDQHMMPITLGTTSRIPPATPDFAGRPTWEEGQEAETFQNKSAWKRWENVAAAKGLTWKANCPEKSYIPQECIRLRVFRTASGLRMRSPVIGQNPPLASVAAMTLALSQVTSMEQS